MTCRRAWLALLALGGCAEPPPQVTLPPSAPHFASLADPVRSAILSSAFVFAQPDSVAGDPAAAAEALANLEYLAAELAAGPAWIEFGREVAPLLAAARIESRTAFDFDPTATPQQAVDALHDTAAALRAGDGPGARSALAALTGTERAGSVLERLAALPRLPRAAFATAEAQNALIWRDRGRDRFWPF